MTEKAYLNLLQRLEDLERRVANGKRLGVVHSVDYDRALARVSFGDVVTDWLQWTTTRASSDVTWWSPEVNEQVLVVCPGGELNSGIITGKLYQTKHPAPQTSPDISYIRFKDGTALQYDRATHVLLADVKGDVLMKVAKTVNCIAGGNITLNTSAVMNLTATTQINMNAPKINMNGALSQGGGSHGGSAVFASDLETKGEIVGRKTISSDVDCLSAGVSGEGHTHECLYSGTQTSSPN